MTKVIAEIIQLDAEQLHARAIDIWEGGACNPRALARELVRSIDHFSENGSDGVSTAEAAPIRVVLAHLCFLLGTSFDSIGGCESSHGDIDKDVERCRQFAK